MRRTVEWVGVAAQDIQTDIAELVAEGWVERIADKEDRRSMIVRMTREGKKQFAEMARAHEAWLEQLLDPLGSPKSHELYEQLGHLRQVLAQES